MLVERDDVVEDSHRPWVNWNRSKFWLSAILADTSISHGKSRRHMIAAAMIGRWDSHCRLFLWTPLPVHPEELGHGDRYIDSTLFSPQAQVWPFEHIPTETFETMKHSEAFEFLSVENRKMRHFDVSELLLWGRRHFFTLSCAGGSGEDWSGLSGGPCPQMWFMLQTRIAWVAADVCMYIRMYIYILYVFASLWVYIMIWQLRDIWRASACTPEDQAPLSEASVEE